MQAGMPTSGVEGDQMRGFASHSGDDAAVGESVVLAWREDRNKREK